MSWVLPFVSCTYSSSNDEILRPDAPVLRLPIETSKNRSGEIILCVDQWEGLTNGDGTGSYAELVKAVFEPKYKVRIKHYPWARAQAEFHNKRCDGLIAESKIDDNYYIKPKIILDALELEAYFLKGHLRYEGQKSLGSKKVAWIRGYNFNNLVDYSINFVEINDVKSGYKMLEGERFDILLDYSYTFKDECQSSGANCAKITSRPSGVIERVWVVFHRTKRGRALTKYWDDRMPDLIHEGTPQRIYEQYGQKYPGPF